MAEKKSKYSASIPSDLSKLEKVKKFQEEKEFAEMLLDTVREGLLVLDADLRVVLGNESFYHFFKVEPEGTEGTLLFELGNGQWDIPALHKLLVEILPKRKVVDDYEIEHEFDQIGWKVMLLNARKIDHLQLILLAIEDVTERRKALRELKYLVSRLAESEQKERRRISRLLHDELQQMLLASQMNMKFSFLEVDPVKQEKLAQNMGESMNLLDAAIEKTRQLTGDLNPFVLRSDQLIDILKWVSSRFEEVHGLKTELEIKQDILIPDKKIRVMILQIVRELLFNIVKHADTDRALIRVDSSAEGNLVMEVIDEGCGFHSDKPGSWIWNTKDFGLFNIRERINLFGGKFEIDTAPGKGTRTTIQIQL